jgi:hypothetical protein
MEDGEYVCFRHNEGRVRLEADSFLMIRSHQVLKITKIFQVLSSCQLASRSPLLRDGGGLCASAATVAIFKTTHNLSLWPFCCGMMRVPQLNPVGSAKETFDVVACWILTSVCS